MRKSDKIVYGIYSNTFKDWCRYNDKVLKFKSVAEAQKFLSQFVYIEDFCIRELNNKRGSDT